MRALYQRKEREYDERPSFKPEFVSKNNIKPTISFEDRLVENKKKLEESYKKYVNLYIKLIILI